MCWYHDIVFLRKWSIWNGFWIHLMINWLKHAFRRLLREARMNFKISAQLMRESIVNKSQWLIDVPLVAFLCQSHFSINIELYVIAPCVHLLLLLFKFNWNKFIRYTLFNDCAISKFNYWLMRFTLLYSTQLFILLESQNRYICSPVIFCCCSNFMVQTPYTNWPFTTNKSFPSLHLMENAHIYIFTCMMTQFTLTRETRCWTVFCFLFFVYLYLLCAISLLKKLFRYPV